MLREAIAEGDAAFAAAEAEFEALLTEGRSAARGTPA
jgi:hypothetical protein